MTFEPIVYDDVLDLSSDLKKQQAGTALIQLIKPAVENILTQVHEKTFDYSPFSLSKTLKSKLSEKAGFYLIVNDCTERFYLGTTSSLSRRKAEHADGLRSKDGKNKRSAVAFRDDMQIHGFTSFHFIPILYFTKDKINYPTLPSSESLNVAITKFMEDFVEQPILKNLMDEYSEEMLYNVKTTGIFEKGNTYGGSKQSGKPSKAIAFENYAWESKLLAGQMLNFHRRSFNSKIRDGLMRILTPEEFNNFSGIKFIKEVNLYYFSGKEAELARIKQVLTIKTENKVNLLIK